MLSRATFSHLFKPNLVELGRIDRNEMIHNPITGLFLFASERSSCRVFLRKLKVQKGLIAFLLLFTCIVPFPGLLQATLMPVAEESQDSVICGKMYKTTIKLYAGNILAFEKYSEKYRVWQTPLLIVKDGPTIYLEKTKDQDLYFGDFTPSPSRKFIYISKYYTTLEFPGSDKEILKFSNGSIIDSQTGEELLSLLGTDAAGEWNCDDEWISGDQILFSPEFRQKNCQTPRDTLFVQSTQYPSVETDELILQSAGKSATIFTMPTADGSSLYFLFRYGSSTQGYDCFVAYNNAADGNSFLFYNRADKRLYMTYGIYAQFEPIPESVDFSKCTVLLKNKNNTKHTLSDTLNVGRKTTYIESNVDILSAEFQVVSPNGKTSE